MVYELSHKIAPSQDGSNINNKWKSFTEMLLLSEAEKAQSKDLFDVFNLLLQKNEIQYGNYTLVKEIFTNLRLLDCLKIVEDFEEKFKDTTLQQKGQRLKVTLLAHLAKGHESLWHGTASVRPSVVRSSFVRRQLFPLNDFFSRTTRPIQPNLVEMMPGKREFKFVQIKGLVPFGAPKGAK